MTQGEEKAGGNYDRRLTIEDLAAAWIAAHRLENLAGFLAPRDVCPARRQAKTLADGLGVSRRKLAAASRRFQCPVAAADLPAIAGRFQRFADVFMSYSVENPCEETTRTYLPRIREAEQTLTTLYLDWLADILRDLFPEAAGQSVSAADVLARTGGGSLALDRVR